MAYGDLRGMTRERVRQNYCPKCGAQPGEPCRGVGDDPRPRVANHAERRGAAKAAKAAKRRRVAAAGRGGDLWSRVVDSLPGIDPALVTAARKRPEIVALESEIERALAVHILLSLETGGVAVTLGAPREGEQCIVLYPQFEVGRYRVDFVFTESSRMRLDESVVVELDGHEWHEKTKEQAARDKARDRYLQRQFGKVLHFTGSEVYDDVGKCAVEIIEVYFAHNKLRKTP